ncbi:MAG: carbon-nitrogen hydrolase [Gammaproteobacteria bacterium]|nr:carbon-nitrogen hydrolase [Gammaproteobacteria bacterium]
MKVAVVQHGCNTDYNANLDKSVTGIHEAGELGADIVLLPELHTLPYFCVSEDVRNFDLAESIPGPTTRVLAKHAQDLQIIIVTSIFEQRAKGIYHNTAVVIDKNGSIAGSYRKMHIPDDPGYHEKFYFTPGDQGFVPIETSVGKLGVMVCWDQWFPEGARLMALASAELLFYPSAIGWDINDTEEEKVRQRNAWMTIQKSHAIANSLPVIVSNRIGHENDPTEKTRGANFWGSSFIAGPQGEILAKAPIDKADVIIAEIDAGKTDTIRRIWPYLRDRRIDAYHDIVKRHIE